MRTIRIVSLVAGISVGAASCHSTPGPTPSQPVSRTLPPPSPPTVGSFERGITPRPAPPLPAIPMVDGPLAPKIVYPSANEQINTRDSNFVFGSIGNGHATLTINGAPVKVAPNGTFLAYLPVPPSTSPRYELVARTATDSVRADFPVKVPGPPLDLVLTGKLVVDTNSVSPRSIANTWLRDDEDVRVTVRAPANATAWLQLGSDRLPMPLVNGNTFATDVSFARLQNGSATLYVARDADTAKFAVGRSAPRAPRPVPHAISLGDAKAQADTDAYIIARDIPAGTYKWMFVPGTVVQETGRSGDQIRVRLDSQLEVWVDSSSVRTLTSGYPVPRRVVGAMALVPSPEWVDVIMPVQSPPPYLIEQTQNRISLTLYGTTATPEVIKFIGNDSLVRMINWVPVASDRIRIDLDLTVPPYGYLVMFDRRGLVLRLRRPPHIANVARPLEGLTITVDPGHPPGGAIGPTGYTEAQGTLAVAQKLRTMLEQRGAKVVMTRTDMRPVDLHLRSVIARQTNSNALLSIHENAFGEGTDPFPNVGTSTLFFHPQSEPLARLVQAGMMREMGLRDLGVHYQNIAIGRTMWMPSIISEGLFLMVPEQEYAAMNPEFQERYARGVADGVEAYFRSFAQR